MNLKQNHIALHLKMFYAIQTIMVFWNINDKKKLSLEARDWCYLALKKYQGLLKKFSKELKKNSLLTSLQPSKKSASLKAGSIKAL